MMSMAVVSALELAVASLVALVAAAVGVLLLVRRRVGPGAAALVASILLLVRGVMLLGWSLFLAMVIGRGMLAGPSTPWILDGGGALVTLLGPLSLAGALLLLTWAALGGRKAA